MKIQNVDAHVYTFSSWSYLWFCRCSGSYFCDFHTEWSVHDFHSFKPRPFWHRRDSLVRNLRESLGHHGHGDDLWLAALTTKFVVSFRLYRWMGCCNTHGQCQLGFFWTEANSKVANMTYNCWTPVIFSSDKLYHSAYIYQSCATQTSLSSLLYQLTRISQDRMAELWMTCSWNNCMNSQTEGESWRFEILKILQWLQATNWTDVVLVVLSKTCFWDGCISKPCTFSKERWPWCLWDLDPLFSFFNMIFDMGFCIDKLVGGPNASPVWDTHGMELHPCRRAMVFTALANDASSKKLLGSYLGWVVGESWGMLGNATLRCWV